MEGISIESPIPPDSAEELEQLAMNLTSFLRNLRRAYSCRL